MITFDEEMHTYTDEKGNVLPSVTQAISFLYNFSNVPDAVLEEKRCIGVAVHKACEYLDNETLDFNSVAEKIIGHVTAYACFKKDTQCKILQNEHIVYNKYYRYAGTLDRIIEMPDGEKVLMDIKTSSTIGPQVGLQLAGYDLADMDMTGRILRMNRVALQLFDDGSYKLHRFTDYHDDDSAFVAAVTIFNWRTKHGII